MQRLLPIKYINENCRTYTDQGEWRCPYYGGHDVIGIENEAVLFCARTDDVCIGYAKWKAKQEEEDTEQGQKFDQGKPDYTLLEPLMLEAYTRVREFGNRKYEPDSWKSVPNAYRRYLAAALRHLIAELSDPRGKDEDSGLPHIWHALCNLGFLCYFLEHPDDES